MRRSWRLGGSVVAFGVLALSVGIMLGRSDLLLPNSWNLAGDKKTLVSDTVVPPFSIEELDRIEQRIIVECNDFVANSANFETTRQRLLKDIWKKSDPLPSRLPVRSLQGHPPPNGRVAAVENVSKVLHFEIDIGRGFRSIVRYHRPLKESTRLNRLMIVQQGHGCLGDHSSDAAVVSFLGSGFDVLFCDMPMSGENHRPPEVEVAGGCGHAGMAALARDDFNPLELFFNHLPTGIRLAANSNGEPFFDISMCGISGGAWTTTVYAALDPQIRFSFPVSGSTPHQLRPDGGENEYEGHPQQSIYAICQVHLMSLLAIHSFETPGNQATYLNRGQIQCYNANDSVMPVLTTEYCYPLKYTQGVKKAAAKFGGLFAWSIESGQHQHRLGLFHVEKMLKVLNGEYDDLF